MIAEKTSETLAEKLRNAETSITLTHGAFVLFVLIERDETPGKWDLLVSAEWLDTNRKGVDQMVDGLKPYLTPSDWRSLASITPLSPLMSYVQWITRKYKTQHDVLEVNNTFWDGAFVSHAFLVTADQSSALVESSLAAA